MTGTPDWKRAMLWIGDRLIGPVRDFAFGERPKPGEEWFIVAPPTEPAEPAPSRLARRAEAARGRRSQ